jgi:hypothetical protein
MPERAYISDASPWWDVARQEAALADVIAGGATVFRDLIDRGKLLRVTTRPVRDETIFVAALPCLSQDELDFRACLRAVEARGAVLRSVSDGTVFSPRDPREPILSAWRAAKVAARAEGAGSRGGAATKAKLEPVYKARIDKIASRWGDPRFTEAELLAEANVVRNTAVKHLGKTFRQAFIEKRAALRAAEARSKCTEAQGDGG